MQFQAAQETAAHAELYSVTQHAFCVLRCLTQNGLHIEAEASPVKQLQQRRDKEVHGMSILVYKEG